MPKTVNRSNWIIQDVHPCEYATWFGDGTRDGILFYNCCAQSRSGEVIANPEWDEEQWRALSAAALRLAGSPSYRAEEKDLRKLSDFAIYMVFRVKSTSPWISREI